MMAAPKGTTQTSLPASIRPVAPRLGDFIEVSGESDQKLRLTECPLCALDPNRERRFFDSGDKPNYHFFNEHGPDDIGRPMAELLPERAEPAKGGDA